MWVNTTEHDLLIALQLIFIHPKQLLPNVIVTHKICEFRFSIIMSKQHLWSCVLHIMSWPWPWHAPLSLTVKKLFCVSQEFHFLLTSGSGCPKRTLQHKYPLFINRPSHPRNVSLLSTLFISNRFHRFLQLLRKQTRIDRRVGCKSDEDTPCLSKSEMTASKSALHPLEEKGLIVITTQVGISVEEEPDMHQGDVSPPGCSVI